MIVETTTDITSLLVEPQPDDRMWMVEAVQEALIKGAKVVTDMYLWQCILNREVFDPASYEVVR